MGRSFRLGAFDLGGTLGSGGMGQVWEATHRPTGTRVAVKVMQAHLAEGATWLAAFDREVRAVAGLDHPCVVRVHDHGVVTEREAQASRGEMVAGAPYLVMERARGTLVHLQGDVEWPDILWATSAVLSGLAHAHARRVLHRDVKPSNVLLFDGTGPKLTDFGLARIASDDPDGLVAGGTPRYMAPEQHLGRWRDEGPWTDLYAVGCLLWELVCGEPLFPDARGDALRNAHALADPGPFLPELPVPGGLEEVLRRLLAKDPLDRLGFAPDALRLLQGLGPAPGGLRTPRARPGRPSPSTIPTGNRTASLSAITAEFPEVPAFPASALPPLLPAAVEVPDTWRGPGDVPTSSSPGIGLGVYPLRTVPLVGRTRERDALWDALRAAIRDGARAVVLEGAPGHGKSRLARWLCEQVEELGIATSFRATHDRRPGPLDGLVAMVERAFRCQGLSRGAVAARVATWDPDAGLAAWSRVTELLRPRGPDDALDGLLPVVLSTEEARLGVVAETLLRRAARRPLVLWLDDAQWGPEALALTARLLGDPAPILAVLTRRSDPDPDLEAVAAARWEPVLQHARTTVVPVDALAGATRSALVRGLLGLREELAAEVEARTEGNPLFAVQLVGDWVQRGLLVTSDGGYRLRPGADARIPAALHQMWSARVDDLLAGRPESERRAVELAAWLGQRVDEDEWRRLCQREAAPIPGDLVARMARRGLVRSEEAGWSFTHGMVAESIRRTCEDAGRDRELRAAVIAFLRALAEPLAVEGRGQPTATLLERALRLAGREGAEAGHILLDLGRARTRAGDYAGAEAALAEALAAHGRAGDPRGEAGTRTALGDLEIQRGRARSALPHLEEGARLASLLGDGVLAAQVESLLAVRAFQVGEVTEALARFERALGLLETLDDRRALAVLRVNHGVLLLRLGRREEARATIEAGCALHRELGHRRSEAIALGNLGLVHSASGRLAEALALIERSLAIHQDLGDRQSVASDEANAGRLEGRLGRPDAARVRLERARAMFRELGNRRAEGVVGHHLADVCAQVGDEEGAERRYLEALAIHREVGNRRFEAISLTALAELLVGAGRRGPGAPAAKLERARRLLLDALPLVRGLGEPEGSIAVLADLARVDARLGGDGLPHIREAEALARSLGPCDLLSVLCARVEVEVAQDLPAAASGSLAEAEATFASIPTRDAGPYFAEMIARAREVVRAGR